MGSLQGLITQSKRSRRNAFMPTPETNEITKTPEMVIDAKPALPPLRLPPPESAKSGTCPTCSSPSVGTTRASVFVYALGRIEPRFPRISVEKELAQATGQA